MFNFSGKGNNGLFSSTPVIKNISHNVNRETRIDPEDNQPGSIDFWYDYAMGLKKGVLELIDTKSEAQRIAIERRANDAGLRAVIRELLKTLEVKDPKHPLLDKQNRDRIFTEFESDEMAKVLKSSGKKPWTPRERPDENQSE